MSNNNTADKTQVAQEIGATNGEGLAIYIHWPFCLSKCPYCDFNTYVRNDIDHDQWKSALLKDLDHWQSLAPARKITSIFFGGGTPSLMSPSVVSALIDRVALHWKIESNVEITIEANPTSTEVGRLTDFRAAGVNRVSLGIQALNDRALLFLGRNHNARDAIDAIRLASSVFDRFSFDLIYSRPEQTLSGWREELEQALSLTNNHLSIYQLTIEPGTVFNARKRRGKLKSLGEDQAIALYEETQLVMSKAGLPAYEISNHAVPGDECQHNLTYWRYGDYAGIGPGAHSRITSTNLKYAYNEIRGPQSWLHSIGERGHGILNVRRLGNVERFEEMMMMGLRLNEPLPFTRIEREAQKHFEQAVNVDQLKGLVDGGFLKVDDWSLSSTLSGRQRLDSVLARLLS